MQREAADLRARNASLEQRQAEAAEAAAEQERQESEALQDLRRQVHSSSLDNNYNCNYCDAESLY